MSYSANQYNNATPLSSAAGFMAEESGVVERKYFTLFDNKLDGSYVPITGDAGLWGTSVADANGSLSNPFVVTITDNAQMRAFRMTSSPNNYPVDFMVDFYKGSTLVAYIDETDNDKAEYFYYFDSVVDVTHYVITVTRISSGGNVAKLYNVYNPAIMKRKDTLVIAANGVSTLTEAHYKTGSDVLYITAMPDTSRIRNTVRSADVLNIADTTEASLYNIHSVMKSPSRQVYGKVYITYTDPMLDSDTTITSNLAAYNSNMPQLLDGQRESEPNLFTLYENDLTGAYVLSDEFTQVGWTSGVLSYSDGAFDADNPPTLTVSFTARPIVGLSVYFDDSHKCLPKDFTVAFVDAFGETTLFEFVDNQSSSVVITEDTVPNITDIIITVHSATRAGYPVTILDVPVASTILYRGYQDTSKLMSIDMLEELTYEDEIEALGGVSANECTVVLDNSDKEFNFNNRNSAAAKQLKRNRKIEPWLGADIIPGITEWYKLGTYWSYRWTVPVGSLTATVVGFDTLGLLDTTSYTQHCVQVNKSIGELIEYVLEDAKAALDFITYRIDAALYSIIIPYAWFEPKSHTAALRKISKCYPMHIYCDRDGCICAAPQKLRLDYYYDTWSDSTNVLSKEYSSLYTALPNIVNVTVVNPTVAYEEQLASDDTAFVVSPGMNKLLSFNKPYINSISVSIDCDSTVQYTYEVYSWCISIVFTGSGTVRSIACSGNVVDVSSSSIVTQRDDMSVYVNGAVTRDISSDFIQTRELAATILERVFSLSENDKYDANVEYRGDIALTINDPIRLLDGIAPDNRYNIKRHKLFWNGALSGSADLNT